MYRQAVPSCWRLSPAHSLPTANQRELCQSASETWHRDVQTPLDRLAAHSKRPRSNDTELVNPAMMRKSQSIARRSSRAHKGDRRCLQNEVEYEVKIRAYRLRIRIFGQRSFSRVNSLNSKPTFCSRWILRQLTLSSLAISKRFWEERSSRSSLPMARGRRNATGVSNKSREKSATSELTRSYFDVLSLYLEYRNCSNGST